MQDESGPNLFKFKQKLTNQNNDKIGYFVGCVCVCVCAGDR